MANNSAVNDKRYVGETSYGFCLLLAYFIGLAYNYMLLYTYVRGLVKFFKAKMHNSYYIMQEHFFLVSLMTSYSY